MQKALKVGVGEMSRQSLIGFPMLRMNTAVGGWPYPQLPSQRLVTNDSATAGLSTSAQSSIFQQYPALRLLLDPVQWPPIGHRLHWLSSVQKSDTAHPNCVWTPEAEFESSDLQSTTSECNNISISEVKQSLEKVARQLPVHTERTAVGSLIAEKKRAKPLQRSGAQSSQVTELRDKLKAQKLLMIKTELRHSQHSALRAWAVESKRARAEAAHKTELARVTSHGVADQRELEKRLESCSAKFVLKMSRLTKSLQLSKEQLHERRLWLLSPCGRRWRMQRIILQMWVAGCAKIRKTGVHHNSSDSKRKRSGTSRPACPPPMPSIKETAESSSDTDRLSACVLGSPKANSTSEPASCGLGVGGCDRAWGCMHHQTYSKGLLLLHREFAQRVAQGPPGLHAPPGLSGPAGLSGPPGLTGPPGLSAPPGLGLGLGAEMGKDFQFKLVSRRANHILSKPVA